MENEFTLESLEVYKLALQLSDLAWNIYIVLKLDQKIIIGQQFVRSVDSIGANIAEGYGRYHYLDKIKFYYTSRASLFEAKHWINLLIKRDLISEGICRPFLEKCETLRIKLNAWIKFNRDRKEAANNT